MRCFCSKFLNLCTLHWYSIITMYLKPCLRNTFALFLINKWHLSIILEWFYIIRISRFIGLLQKLKNLLWQSYIRTVYSLIIETHLGHGDIIYFEAYQLVFLKRLESIERDAYPGVIGVGVTLIENQEKTVFELKALNSLSNCESICPHFFIFSRHLSFFPMIKHTRFSASHFFSSLDYVICKRFLKIVKTFRGYKILDFVHFHLINSDWQQIEVDELLQLKPSTLTFLRPF